MFLDFSKETFNSCNMIWPEPKNVWSTAFILYTATVGFFGPLLIICLCYLLIVIKVPHKNHPGARRRCRLPLSPGICCLSRR